MEELIINGAPDLEEQKRYLQQLIKTRKATLPGNRDYGLEGDFLDAPPAEAGTRFTMDVYTAARDWLNEADVAEADLSAAENGEIVMTIKLEGREEYV